MHHKHRKPGRKSWVAEDPTRRHERREGFTHQKVWPQGSMCGSSNTSRHMGQCSGADGASANTVGTPSRGANGASVSHVTGLPSWFLRTLQHDARTHAHTHTRTPFQRQGETTITNKHTNSTANRSSLHTTTRRQQSNERHKRHKRSTAATSLWHPVALGMVSHLATTPSLSNIQ